MRKGDTTLAAHPAIFLDFAGHALQAVAGLELKLLEEVSGKHLLDDNRMIGWPAKRAEMVAEVACSLAEEMTFRALMVLQADAK